jgi:hypothetical protein
VSVCSDLVIHLDWLNAAGLVLALWYFGGLVGGLDFRARRAQTRDSTTGGN